MSTKKFKAESKRLLELMINSIYTNKEIFLRELISNASDAIDKSYYMSLTNESLQFNKDDFYILVQPNEEENTLTISDRGIGMDKEELEDNLGIIAKSGSFSFKNDNELPSDVEIIGQFGVGFYSAFMVASEITVISKKIGSETAYKWTSKGEETFTIDECTKETFGTDIILKLKDNTENEEYDQYLDENRLKSLIKKYSDFIKYPIKMSVTKTKEIDGKEGETEEYIEIETLNSMVPIWRKNKNELKKEDYEAFYRDKHFGFDVPLHYIHYSVDGAVSYNAILYIPSSAPFDFYNKEYAKGLELYSNGVLIMDHCAALLPDYFSFVKGVVDSGDLSLNISRETLQQDAELRLIGKKISEKIKKELISLQSKNRKDYEVFWSAFKSSIKFGAYNNYGMDKDFLVDLLMFTSSKEKSLRTLDEVVSELSSEDKYIYYATGDSAESIAKLPQAELLLEEGKEILFLTDEVDEFVLKVLMKYKDKEFKSVKDVESTDKPEQTTDDEELLTYIKTALEGKISAVTFSNKLKSHPVCLGNDGGLSIEMEKVLSAMPNGDLSMKATKVLEINKNHEIYNLLKVALLSDKDKLSKLANVLYNQALLIEGLPVEDPAQYSSDVCSLLN